MHCTFSFAGPIGPPGLLASENEMARTQIWVAPGHRAMCYVVSCACPMVTSVCVFSIYSRRLFSMPTRPAKSTGLSSRLLGCLAPSTGLLDGRTFLLV